MKIKWVYCHFLQKYQTNVEMKNSVCCGDKQKNRQFLFTKVLTISPIYVIFAFTMEEKFSQKKAVT